MSKCGCEIKRDKEVALKEYNKAKLKLWMAESPEKLWEMDIDQFERFVDSGDNCDANTFALYAKYKELQNES